MVVTGPGRLSFDDVLRMVEAGALREDERVELLDGVLVPMSPEGLDHYACADRAIEMLQACYRATPFRVRSGRTLPLGEHVVVEPDVVVSSSPSSRWPRPADVALVVELSSTSVRRDLTEKVGHYAAWPVREYWVVDIARRAIVRHRRPSPDGYDEVDVIAEGSIEPPGAPAGAAIDADEFFRAVP